ncbi:MAG: hypothetical protein KC731_20875 [Myxococcales bacterium]|nr:hypothetical protein [Myxococcales bacterium]
MSRFTSSLLVVGILTACSPASDGTGGGGSGVSDGGRGSHAVGAGGAGAGDPSPGGSGAGAGGEGGAAPPGKVPVFVAQGHMGMTAVSCDDGNTWTGYRTFETEASPLLCGDTTMVSCFSGPCSYLDGNGQCQQSTTCDCDHSPGSGKGLAYGDGAFVATFGWGQPGVVLRSENGFDWTEVDSGHTYADVAAGDGMIVLSDRAPMVSTDAGLSYSQGSDAQHMPWNVRRLFYFPNAGLFMQTAASGPDRDLRLTGDFTTWSSPSQVPADCTAVTQAVEGGSVIVTSPHADYVCTSTDGADTFTRHDLPGGPSITAGPIWDGSQFMLWGWEGGIKVYVSPDGQSWSAIDTNIPSNERLGEVVRSPVTGTLVAPRGQWMSWYDQMKWYRSSDGITWETLAPADGIASHPVREMAFGYAEPSAACPAP